MSELPVEPTGLAAEKEGSYEPAYCLCTPVIMNPFMTDLNPNAIIGRCVRCSCPIWIDAMQDLPQVGSQPFRPLCLGCAVVDPEIGPSLKDWFPEAVIEYYTEGTTSVWGKDGKRIAPAEAEQGTEGDSLHHYRAG